MDAFDTLPLHFLHLKLVSGFRGPLMFEQRLCIQRHRVRVNPNTLIAPTTGKFAPINWFWGIMSTKQDRNMVKHELRVESLKARVKIQKCEFKSTSY